MEKTHLKTTEYKKIHFIGIGGVSMAALAALSLYNGSIVSGSDTSVNTQTKNLKKLDIKIYNSHKKQNIKDYDLVVYTAAIDKDNQELLQSYDNGIKVLSRAEYLGEICKHYKNVIAISGMHGKTTTTAMIATVLLRAGFNPSIHIGGDFGLINGNLHIGSKDYFLTEACEYKDSFLSVFADVSVITNIEAEHLDYFKNIKNINKSFNVFVNNTSKICFIDDRYKNKINSHKLVTFGINRGDIQAREVKLRSNGKYSFKAYKNDKFMCNINLRTQGKHNIYNALACIAVCDFYKVAYKKIASALSLFENVKRRFDFSGLYKSNIIVHDYAHHPTEIKNAIKTARETYNKPVVCVFQPHTYSRTKTLFNKFLTSFKGVSSLHIIKTYPAREEYDYEGSSEKLIKELSKTNINVFGEYTLKEFEKFFYKCKLNDCVILFLGAGTIENIIKNLKKVLTI